MKLIWSTSSGGDHDDVHGDFLSLSSSQPATLTDGDSVGKSDPFNKWINLATTFGDPRVDRRPLFVMYPKKSLKVDLMRHSAVTMVLNNVEVGDTERIRVRMKSK